MILGFARLSDGAVHTDARHLLNGQGAISEAALKRLLSDDFAGLVAATSLRGNFAFQSVKHEEVLQVFSKLPPGGGRKDAYEASEGFAIGSKQFKVHINAGHPDVVSGKRNVGDVVDSELDIFGRLKGGNGGFEIVETKGKKQYFSGAVNETNQALAEIRKELGQIELVVLNNKAALTTNTKKPKLHYMIVVDNGQINNVPRGITDLLTRRKEIHDADEKLPFTFSYQIVEPNDVLR